MLQQGLGRPQVSYAAYELLYMLLLTTPFPELFNALLLFVCCHSCKQLLECAESSVKSLAIVYTSALKALYNGQLDTFIFPCYCVLAQISRHLLEKIQIGTQRKRVSLSK